MTFDALSKWHKPDVRTKFAQNPLIDFCENMWWAGPKNYIQFRHLKAKKVTDAKKHEKSIFGSLYHEIKQFSFTDSFKVSGTSGLSTPIICGSNAGQHSKFAFKVENISKGKLDSISSSSTSVKIQSMGGKVWLRCI